jgi:hypothetical protein
VRTELADVADPPDVIALAVLVCISPFHLAAADFLAQRNGLQHRAVAVPASSHVVDFAGARVIVEVPKGVDQIVTMNVVPDLLGAVSKHLVGNPVYGAFHQVSQETV